MRRDILELAHRLCIEGMTRKVTLPFNIEEDSLYECFDGLYAFLGFCRETLKSYPTDYMPVYDKNHVLDPNNLYDLCFILINHLDGFLGKYGCNFRYYVEQEKSKGELDPGVRLIEIEKKYPTYSEIVTQLAEDSAYYKDLIMNMYKQIGGH